jgi:hypothetical protein
MYTTEQAAAEYVAVSGQSFMKMFTAVAGDAQDFVSDNPIVLVFVVVLAVFFFTATRPRAR